MTLRDLFIDFTEENNIPAVKIPLEPEMPDQICIYLNGKNGNFEGHAMFFEEERLFVFYVPLGAQVPEEKRNQMALHLMNLNYQLKTGGIYFETETGELTARVSHYMQGADWEKQELMEQLVSICGKTADYYYPELMKLLFG